MAEQDQQPQIYLISPPQFALPQFAEDLGRLLDAVPVGCFRLALTTTDEDEILRAADALRETCHARDVAIVIEQHFRMVDRLGLDGCHLPNGAAKVRDVRAELGNDTIVGVHCGASRHAGISASEAGADYVSFGPVTPTSLGDGQIAGPDLFKWWSEVIEVPVVAEGGLSDAMIAQLAPVTDFLGLGAEIWADEVPVRALKSILAKI